MPSSAVGNGIPSLFTIFVVSGSFGCAWEYTSQIRQAIRSFIPWVRSATVSPSGVTSRLTWQVAHVGAVKSRPTVQGTALKSHSCFFEW